MERRIVLVTGYSGSGKSELTEFLGTELRSDTIHVGRIMLPIAKKRGFEKVSDFMDSCNKHGDLESVRTAILNVVIKKACRGGVVVDGVYDPTLANEILSISSRKAVVGVFADKGKRALRIARRHQLTLQEGLVEVLRRDGIKLKAGINRVAEDIEYLVDNNGSMQMLKDNAYYLARHIRKGI